METSKSNIRNYDIAYACFTFCGGVALFIGVLSFVPMGTGTAGGIGILIMVPLSIASIGAMIAGLVYTVILFKHWPFVLLSLLSLLFIAEVVTEFGPVVFYNLVPVIYGIITSIFGFLWFTAGRKHH
jgi:hypothetical protein